MDGERSHRSGGSSSELFICFTSRPSNSSSMKISSKSILSPGRTDKIREGTLSTLPSSLSRRLRSNGSMKGGQSSPMFPTCTKKKGGCAFETAEPSSPKVTCIGQVRVKTKKQGKKKKKPMRTTSKRWGEDGSFRKTEQGQEAHLQQEYLPSRAQKWVHLPLSICEALRAFGAEFNCFVPCGGWRSSCSSNSGAEREKGEKQRRRRSSCGAVFARWLMVLQESEEEKRRQIVEERVELVGEEEEDEEKAKVEEEKGEAKIDVEIDEVEEVSICIPPRNALLLMRCRSEPLRMSSLATRFWDSPAPKEEENEVVEEEEEDDDDDDDDDGDEKDEEAEQQMEIEAQQSEEKAVAFDKEHLSPEKEEKEEVEEQEEGGLEKGSLAVALDMQENSKEECKEEEETHLWRTAAEGEKEEKEEEDTQLQKAGKDPEEEGEEPQLHEIAEAEAGEGGECLHLHERAAAAVVEEEGEDTQLQETAAIAAEDDIEEAQLPRTEAEAQLQETVAVAAKQEREETLLQKTDAEVQTPETEEEEAGGREEEVEAQPQKAAGGEESHLPNAEEQEEKEGEGEGDEGERKEKIVEERRMSFCSTASVQLEKEEGEEAEKSTMEEKENAEGMAAVEVAASESEEMSTAGEEWRMVEGRGEERERSPQLPDCLLLMMCEPKLSMEVSKETWVSSTDFLRHRPHKAAAAPAPQAGKRKEAVVEDCRRLSTDSNPAYLPPVTAVAPNPARQQPLSVATVIERKLVNPKVYQPFALTRCKSEPMRSSAKLAPEACFWKSRRLPPPPRPVGISATGVRR